MPRAPKKTTPKKSTRKTKNSDNYLDEDSRTLTESSYMPLFVVAVVIILIIMVIRNVTYKHPEAPVLLNPPTLIEDTTSTPASQVKNLPAGWPDEVDLIDGATLKTSTEDKEKNTKVVIFTTSQSAEDIVSFYNRKLADAAWQGKGFRVASSSSVYTYAKGGSILTIEVGKKTPITVTLTLQN